MATKKKTKNKSTKSKKAATPKKTQTKKKAIKRPAKKQARKGPAPKKSAKKTAAPSKAVTKKGLVRESTPGKKSRGRRAPAFSPEMLGPRSGGQSGDLQGLSDVEAADSESVDELIEEGNAFEAGIVTGVEEAGRRGTKEVTTREVPEDDVPAEYLDED
jgi:hypothetical protein